MNKPIPGYSMDDSNLAERVVQLEKEIKHLRSSDRRLGAKLRAQQRLSMVFACVVAIGAALSMNGLSPENRASLEDVATGVIVMGLGGIGVAGVTSSRFKPPGHGDDEEDEN